MEFSDSENTFVMFAEKKDTFEIRFQGRKRYDEI